MSLHFSPLTIKDQSRLHQAFTSTLGGAGIPLAAWSFQPHFIWKDLLTYSWAEIEGWWCLFAEYPDGLYMPLPPVNLHPESGSPVGNLLKDVLKQVMEFMDIRNRGSKVTRIENIPAELKKKIQQWGYILTPKDPDYLYCITDLIHLKGNAYKSQRGAYNRFVRAHRIRLFPYQLLDHDSCLALFYRWVHQKEEAISVSSSGANQEVARLMLQDAVHAHRVALQQYQELGLTGRIVWVDGSVRAYTFGYPQSQKTFCILLEVADRSVYGLAQYLFREFCREFQEYPFVNTMDDSGLPNLARAKQAYHPCQLIPNYIAEVP